MEQKPLFESRRDWNKEFEAYLQENKTLAYMMLKKSEEFKDFVALSQKNKNNQWESITWNEFGSKIKAIAKALIDLKLQPGEMCAIFLKQSRMGNSRFLVYLPQGLSLFQFMQLIQKRKQNI
jgi:long-subunit acyl-CoA synthetase (AMP-forming)